MIEDKAKIRKACGHVLRELREEKHLTQEKLAALCDLDRTFIYRLEAGLRQPTITTLFMIGSVLKVSPSAIVRLVEKQLKEHN